MIAKNWIGEDFLIEPSEVEAFNQYNKADYEYEKFELDRFGVSWEQYVEDCGFVDFSDRRVEK